MDIGKLTDLQPMPTEEGIFLTRHTKKYERREKWERPNPREVYSYIPGMVVRIAAQEGQQIAAGSPILTFEAMKMENTLTMPFDGVVRKICVKVGDVFPKNIILAEIDSA